MPFSGISCGDVDAMCRGSPLAGLTTSTLKRFVAVKTQNAGCSSGRAGALFSQSMVPMPVGAQQQRSSVMLLVLPGVFAVGLALSGLVLLVQHFTARRGQAPLLSDY